MSVKDQTSVLLDQNLNTLPPSWMPRTPPDGTDYLTQCDRVSTNKFCHVSHENKPVSQTEHKFKVPYSIPSNSGDSALGDQKMMNMKEHLSDHPVNGVIQPRDLDPAHSDEERDDVVTEDDPSDSQDTVNEVTLHKRVCLVKLYAWIKEEMSKSAAKSIASHLYQSEHKLLSRTDHESILHCSWRRDAVEQLLKKVLMGPCDIHEVFIRALKEQEEKHIADRLDSEMATEVEIQVFSALEQSSLGQCHRPDIHEQRLTFTESDHQTLLYYLNNKNIIDNINDHLLSRFIFSIREHTNVVHCSIDCEKRVRQLIDTMKVCAEKVFKDFCEILSSIEMSHVIRKLEKRNSSSVTCRQRQKRKSTPQQDSDTTEQASTSTSAKRQCMSTSVECRLVTSMQRSSSTLRLHALDQLGFDVENVNNGSIVIQLCPKEPDSWSRLEENCRSGKIKDFIPVVYNNEAVHELLEDGEYRLKFTIYTLPTQPDKQEEKKVMFHLETEEQQPKGKTETDAVSNGPLDNQIEEYSDLLCEELEISKDLLSLLKKEKLVDENIKEEIDKQGSRVKKIKYLLKKVGQHGQKGYEVLKEYIKEENEDLYKAMVTREGVKAIDNKMDTAAKVTKNRPFSGGHRGVYKKEVFFTGTVLLVVKKNFGKKKETKIEITCPEILDPVCHFTDKGKENQSKSGEVTMVLEEAWGLVGANQQPKREILVGKRKQSKDSLTSSKKAHSSLEEEDDEITANAEEEIPDTDLTSSKKAHSSLEEEDDEITANAEEEIPDTDLNTSETEKTSKGNKSKETGKDNGDDSKKESKKMEGTKS